LTNLYITKHHDIERFLPIGDSLWAPAAQPDFAAPFNAATAPEYAIATGVPVRVLRDRRDK
jgi:hypothetical protein